MPRAGTYKLTGFRELERNLAELPKAVGKNVLRRTSRGALEPMAAAAAAGAPYRTGKLAYSISISEKRTRGAASSLGSTIRLVGGKWRRDSSTGVEMAMGPASWQGVLRYAGLDEFGTVDTPAFAYMRRAWDGYRMNALHYVQDNLGSEILRAADRLARRKVQK